MPVPILVGDYIIKVFDTCSPPQVGYFDLTIPEEVSEPNVTLVPYPPLPHPDPFLDCIAVGEVLINHVLYLDKGENQDSEFLDINGNRILPGLVEIIDGPADFKYFLSHYVYDTTLQDFVYAGPGLGMYGLDILDENNPLDITHAAGLHPQENSDPPNPDTLTYPAPTPYGTPRPIFPGLVGAGEYTIRITDICGNTWEITEELGPYFTEATTFSVNLAPGCDDLGSIEIIPGFDETVGEIEWAIVTQAPTEFYDRFGEDSAEYGNPDIRRNVLDASGNPVLDGDGNPLIVFDTGQEIAPQNWLYWYYVQAANPADPGYYGMRMGGLPPGDYIMDVKSGCAFGEIEFTIEGYEQELIDFERTEYCGNFSFIFDYTSNSSDGFASIYALERCTQDDVEDCEESDWLEVMTGLTPDQLVTGATGVGHYRIVKYYQVYANDVMLGTGPILETCKVTIHEFDYFATPGIKSIDVVSCPGGGSMTIIDANGAEPLTYQLVEVTVDGSGVVT